MIINNTPVLSLPSNITFADLYTADGLARLDVEFLQELQQQSPDVYDELLLARGNPSALSKLEESTLILTVAPFLEQFLVKIFGIKNVAAIKSASHLETLKLFEVRRNFVQRQAIKNYGKQAHAFDGSALWRQLLSAFPNHSEDPDMDFANAVLAWQSDADKNADILDTAMRYASWKVIQKDNQSVLFKEPKKLDFANLVHTQKIHRSGVEMLCGDDDTLRVRDGFTLTDNGGTLKDTISEATYCIHCHNQGKDSCSQGLKDKKTGEFQKSPLGVTLNGCPLEEKISEMHTLKIQGHFLSALAVITIDNPMAAATGHRICNDCMKACIYQKQDPVNIPQAETGILRDVLQMPYGFEIYSLLTRWNPLNINRPFPKSDTGKKVLVVGMGPAGFTLAHHLMNDGHTVVAIDGAKIEPLPEWLNNLSPIADINQLWENLNDRIAYGFGGVAEYGITVRWDKNFLKVIRLLLQRRTQFALFGGIRFGGTITVTQAFDQYGFDHVALCAGAGAPTVIDMKNGLAKGVRQASDFLMALQLTGAAKADSIANLQIRLPVAVIGGGLTGIDTTTEAMAYYPVMVEKVLKRYEKLCEIYGDDKIRASYGVNELQILDEYLSHAKQLRAERLKENPDIIGLLRSWGGSTLVYRKGLTDAPSYTLNHEEVEKALEEGIFIATDCNPVAVEVDEHGWASGLTVKQSDGSIKTIPARTILVAAGTKPNVVLHDEDPVNIAINGRYFQAIDENGQPVTPENIAKPSVPHVLTSRYDDHRFISFFGDMHPSFAGNVVKAMGSAKQGYPIISRVLSSAPSQKKDDFIDRLNHDLLATIHAVNRLTPNIVEVVVHAPQAARQFQAGQFYRLQNFESLAPVRDDTKLAMEGIAATGAWVDVDKGLLATIILEMGGSSSICKLLNVGEPVILMGPTGEPTHVPNNSTVMLIGGGLGNAVLFSIGAAMKAAGSRVLYFAGYKKSIDRYHMDKIESASDVVIWCCDEPAGFIANRPQDKVFTGNIVQAIVAYSTGVLGDATIKTDEVEHLIVIGSDRMMNAVKIARHGILLPYLSNLKQAIGSINSPMQCMMKKICAQCLQIHRDPITGAETVIYSCHNQDQELDRVDFNCLHDRLSQNRTLEILTSQWIAAVV